MQCLQPDGCRSRFCWNRVPRVYYNQHFAIEHEVFKKSCKEHADVRFVFVVPITRISRLLRHFLCEDDLAHSAETSFFKTGHE